MLCGLRDLGVFPIESETVPLRSYRECCEEDSVQKVDKPLSTPAETLKAVGCRANYWLVLCCFGLSAQEMLVPC